MEFKQIVKDKQTLSEAAEWGVNDNADNTWEWESRDGYFAVYIDETNGKFSVEACMGGCGWNNSENYDTFEEAISGAPAQLTKLVSCIREHWNKELQNIKERFEMLDRIESEISEWE